MSFVNIYSKNINGMLEYAGNTLGLNGSCVSFSSIYQGCNAPGTSGISGTWITTDTTSSANTNWANFVNNLPPTATNGGTTFDYSKNSSSDVINIPPDTIIDYAVLIWSGNNGSGDVDISTKSVDFTTPLGQNQSILPQDTFLSPLNNGYYTCFADVTSVVEQGGNGSYTCGNVYSEFRTNIASAGWLLIVVYESPKIGFVNININVGGIDVSDGNSVSQSLSGFRTSENGPIRAGVIISALNGNPASAGDQVSLTNNQGIETYLSGPLNPVNNFFGAQITDIDGNISKNGTFGNLNATPDSVQTAAGRRMGYDVSIVDAAPALSNNQTTTTITASTSGNGYYINAITSIVVNASPQIVVTATLPSNNVNVGDNYTIIYNISNTGTVHTESLDFTFNNIGLDFISGYYSISSSTIVNTINSTPNSLALYIIEPSESITVSLTYKSISIPNNLIYENRSLIHYTYSVDTDVFENTIEKTIPMTIKDTIRISTTNAQPTSVTVPIMSYTLPNLYYSVIQNPILGEVSVSTQGIITYTPDELIKKSDTFTIKATNSISNNVVHLNYLVDLNIVPQLNITTLEIPSVLSLGSTIDYLYVLKNISNFDITNANAVSGASPGYELISAKSLHQNGIIEDVDRTGSYYTLGTLSANSTTTITVAYLASKISTDLFYRNYTNLQFEFGKEVFSNTSFSDSIGITANLDYNITNDESYIGVVPIVNPTYEHLSYSIKSQGNLGSASVDNNGSLVYIPSNNSVGIDNIILTINNIQQNDSLDIKYTFNIITPDTIPCSQSISSQLLYLLENDIFTEGTDNLAVGNNVCFDCNLWNNGYTLPTGNTRIRPIRTSLISLLIKIKSKLQSILNPTLPNTSCNDYGFKSQVDRFLNIINDFENKIISIPCSNDCCDPNLNGQFLDLLSQSITELITIMSTLEGAVDICNNNCNSCYGFDKLMPTLINSITDFANLMIPWNHLFMNFVNCQSLSTKPYVASYIQPKPINPNFNVFQPKYR